MQQPNTMTITAPNADTLEVVDLGETFVLLQKDETGDTNSIAITGEQLEGLLNYVRSRDAEAA